MKRYFLIFLLIFTIENSYAQTRTLSAKYAIAAAQSFKQAYSDAYRLNYFYTNNFSSYQNNILENIKQGRTYIDSAVLFASPNDSVALLKIKMADIYAKKGIANFKILSGKNENKEHPYIKQGMFYTQHALTDAYYASLLFSDTTVNITEDTTQVRDVTRLETDETSFMTIKSLFEKRIKAIDDEIAKVEASLTQTNDTDTKKRLEDAIANLKEEKARLYSKMNHTEDKLVMVQNDLSEEIFNAVDKDILMMDKNGFYSENNPIPQNVELPQGLVYRIQIGFFMNELPAEHFDGLFPLSTEKIDNVYLRYMVGLFDKYNDASVAKKKIIAKGYTDAFIIAYLNGKRIPIADAVKMEK
ncbi:MAG TPA: hypothetical protein DIU39_03140 [Flavobacteriales bacterium]|nr:hypothetical protein [Flavobacteriales bacterium]|tara:strand:+ start:1378 stop:2448 length:1071 start_codon:yes stop_codon:yes gene_type:complete